MQQRVTALKTDRNVWTPQSLLEAWHHALQEKDRSAGTVKKYTQAVARFLTWYEQEEHAPLTLLTLTPIALIGYRNETIPERGQTIRLVNGVLPCRNKRERILFSASGRFAPVLEWSPRCALIEVIGVHARHARASLRVGWIALLLRRSMGDHARNCNLLLVEPLGCSRLLGSLTRAQTCLHALSSRGSDNC